MTRVLVLQHISCEQPGVFAEVMRERGVEAVPVELDEGEPLPDWREFDAVLVMGGPMSAGDDGAHPWLEPERELIAEAVDGGPPGPRRLPRSPAPRRRPRRPRAEAARGGGRAAAGRADARGPGPPPVRGHRRSAESRCSGTATPSSCPRARSASPPPPCVPNQAFALGDRAIGIQFHLEVTAEMARQWAEVPAYRESLAASLGEEEGAEFLAALERRAEELHPRGAPPLRQLARPG